MKKQIKALEMAIIVLEDMSTVYANLDDTIQACKEALEQPAQEPVAWIKKTWCPELDWYDDFKSGAFADETDKEGWTPLYTHPAPSWQLNKEFVGLSDDEFEGAGKYFGRAI